jgi:methanogenic corrinoid protein MtbC1
LSNIYGKEATVSRLTDPERLRALDQTGLVDTPAEEAFDRLTRVAARALDAPVSLVSLVGDERQFFKSCVGLAEPWATTRQTPLSHSFCQHAVMSARPFVIEDARAHPLLRESPAIEELGVVAYAGIPLVTSNGDVLGSFCVIDSSPRVWSENDLAILRELAAAAMREVEHRRTQNALRPRTRPGGRAAVAAEAEAPGLNIAAIAQRTGVAPDTLRKWEQRYGILRPSRTAGGQRRYGEADVARVQWLRARLAEGYRIGEAAALLGSGTSPVAAGPTQLREALLDAVARVDAQDVARLLDHAFALGRLESTLTDVLVPTLAEVGERWAAGHFTVAQEHLVSGAIRARLERFLAELRGGVNGTAVLACAPGERHDLGLLMLAVLLGAGGWRVTYLGADTPVGDAVSLAERIGANVLGISAALPERLPELEQELGDVTLPPGLDLVVGGGAMTAEWARAVGARYGGVDLSTAVRRLRKLRA